MSDAIGNGPQAPRVGPQPEALLSKGHESNNDKKNEAASRRLLELMAHGHPWR